MRITHKKYEAAKERVAKAKACLRTVKQWEDAMSKIGSVGNQQVVAIKIGDDGSIATECRLPVSKDSAEVADQ